MIVENSIDIFATIETVWNKTIDFETIPSWSPTMTWIKPLNGWEPALGAQFCIKQPMQSVKVWSVCTLQPPYVFAWETEAGRGRMLATHILEREQADSSAITRSVLSIELSAGAPVFVRPFLKWLITDALKRENVGLKSVCEGGAVQTRSAL